MSMVIDSLARHLQGRVNKAEPEVMRLRKRVVELERELGEALALLRVFGREHTHAEIAPRGAFRRAAQMAACRTPETKKPRSP